MKRHHIFCLAILVAGLAFPGMPYIISATAADKNPCADEIAKFCKDVKPGSLAMIDCLEAHENELSNACRAYEEKTGGKRAEMKEDVRQEKMLRQTCEADISKFCQYPGPGGIASCLNERMGELSAPCVKSVTEINAERRHAK